MALLSIAIPLACPRNSHSQTYEKTTIPHRLVLHMQLINLCILGFSRIQSLGQLDHPLGGMTASCIAL